MNDYGLGGLEGRFQIVSDPQILDQVDATGFKSNGFVTTPAVKMDPLQSGMLDLHQLTTTLMLSFQENPGDDFTIIPVQISADFIMAFRQGYGDPTVGPSQELRFEFPDLDIKMQTCQFLSNPEA